MNGTHEQRRVSTTRVRARHRLVGALVLLAAPAVGLAQSAPTLDIQRFDPVTQKPGFTIVRDAEALDQWSFTAGLTFNYALNPFELGDAETTERTAGVVDNLFGFDLGVGFSPLDWLHIGLDLPVLQIISNSPESQAVFAQLTGGAANTIGLGDLKISLDFHPVRQGKNGKISFAIVPYITVPTGTRGGLVGSGAVSAGGDLALGGRWRHFKFSASAGYQFLTDTSPVGTVLADDEFKWGVGLAVPFGDGDRFEVSLEWFGGAVVLADKLAEIGARPFDARHAPTELLLGFGVLPPDKPFFFKVGMGPGLDKGFGAPDLRAFATFGGILRQSDTEPPDADGDGFPDPRDACPGVAEDFDGFEDEDGCPEPDNDFDRILDLDDLCPNDPEDYDTFEDTDGCPDPDNDADTILDVDDACMFDPEDFDGWRDEDGCPEPDNDFDSFLDPVDACPNEPEIINGIDDLDGCPDEALAEVDIEINQIVILEKIYFELDKAIIRPESFKVVDSVYKVIDAFKNIHLVEVQGHTDSRASDAYNLDLSQRRAAAVVEALIERGIDPARLVPRGYGESELVVPDASSEADHALNRRVQFVILEQDGAVIEPGKGKAPQ